MCGIAGTIAADGAAVLAEQVRVLDHRGPDSAGVFDAEAGGIAQNRLRIIDLVTGDPPIANEDGQIGAVLNGEIYNYRALREELEGRGHALGTRGDTEVIAHLAEELEPVELARRLEGMFAFAVLDRRRGRLTIGRDRFGKKPLYYWAGGGKLVFASEIKGLWASPDVPRRLDPGAIPAYLTFGYVPTPRTFFEGVRSLPPGCVLTMAPGGEPEVERYWSAPIPGVDAEPLALSFEESAREVRAALRDAVERRLVSDVPLGAFLSGGIDSSTVVALMAELGDRPVKTFTIGFEDRDGFDEREHARTIARRFGTEHTEFVVKPEAVDLVERLVHHYDQPFGDSSSVPTWALSELTREHVTVALCGDGGDELFAGYERFAAGLASGRFAALPGALRGAVRRAVGTLPATALRGRAGSLQRFAARADKGLPDAYVEWLSYVGDATRRELLREQDDWALSDFRQVWAESEGASTLDRILNVNHRTYLLDDLLPKVDRMAMAHALEVRSPFLDTELAELVLRLPPEHKVGRPGPRGLKLKQVLKASVADLLPEHILERRKRGFGVPLDRWFREDLKRYTGSMLGAPEARVREHLVPEVLDRLLAEHDARERNHGHAIWALLTLEVFLRREGW